MGDYSQDCKLSKSLTHCREKIQEITMHLEKR